MIQWNPIDSGTVAAAVAALCERILSPYPNFKSTRSSFVCHRTSHNRPEAILTSGLEKRLTILHKLRKKLHKNTSLRFGILYLFLTGTSVIYPDHGHQGAVTGGTYDNFGLTIWDDIGFNPSGTVWDFESKYIRGTLVGPSELGFVNIYYQG